MCRYRDPEFCLSGLQECYSTLYLSFECSKVSFRQVRRMQVNKKYTKELIKDKKSKIEPKTIKALVCMQLTICSMILPSGQSYLTENLDLRFWLQSPPKQSFFYPELQKGHKVYPQLKMMLASSANFFACHDSLLR